MPFYSDGDASIVFGGLYDSSMPVSAVYISTMIAERRTPTERLLPPSSLAVGVLNETAGSSTELEFEGQDLSIVEPNDTGPGDIQSYLSL